MNEILTKINESASLIEAEINRVLSTRDESYKVLFDSMLYSAQGGGKRIRPFLTLEFCRALGGAAEAALPLAVAVELVHTYSLIHDDLPCMDNDDIRRGKPSNHKAFGEATALLAGDALLTLAFEIICKSDKLSAESKVRAVTLLSESAGARGMIGGQQLDLIGEGEKNNSSSKRESLTPDKKSGGLDKATHLKMNLLKTGALIKAAALLGCIAADADERSFKAADEYAESLGLAFQVTDDILDNGEEDEKTTFLSFMTLNEAEAYADALTEKAVSAIGTMKNGETLASLAYYLAKRKI